MKSIENMEPHSDIPRITRNVFPSLEYLLGQYCASDDEEIINEGLEKVKDVWIGMFSDWTLRGIFYTLRFHGRKWLDHKVIE